MARLRVALRNSGMRKLLNDPGVRSDLERRGERVLTQARASAPVRSGAFRASLHVSSVTTDRAVVRVGSDHPGALAIEAATGVLARSLGAAGGT